MTKSILVVGAGFTGASAARYLADKGFQVTVIDSRETPGGNAADRYDYPEYPVHLYGPHLFHTNSKKVLDFLSRFTTWVPYEHRVKALTASNWMVPIPFNFTTAAILFNRSVLSDNAFESLLAEQRILSQTGTSSRDHLLRTVGPAILKELFRDYTEKQWRMRLEDLDEQVVKRIPVRNSFDDRYFQDRYQFLPSNGYSNLFKRMLTSLNIEVQLGVQFNSDMLDAYDHVVYTGKIDRFFEYEFGPLKYRSLQFITHVQGSDSWDDLDRLLLKTGVGTLNLCNTAYPYTRITNFSILNRTSSPVVTVRELPVDYGESYYPIPAEENFETLRMYQEQAEKRRPNITFCGRLGSYQYLNMDQACAQGLSLAERIAEKLS